MIARRGPEDVPPSTICVVILGSDGFANHVSRVFRFAKRASDSSQAERSGGETRCELFLHSPGPLSAEPRRVPQVEADVVLCDLRWWRENVANPVIHWVSSNRRPPALLAHARNELGVEQWNDIEREIGAYLVGRTHSSEMPPSESLWTNIVSSLGRRAGRVISERMVESLAATGRLDPDDSCVAAIQLALAAPECFPDEPSFAAAADQLKVRSSSPERPRDSKARAKWRPLRSKNLQRRFRDLGLASPAEFLRQCRLLHGMLWYKMRSLVRPDETPPLGLLAHALGYGRGASAEAALRALNNHAKRLFLGMEFEALVSRVAVEEVVELFGWVIAGELWIGPQPGPVTSSRIFATPEAYDRWLFEAAALNPIDPEPPPVIGFGTTAAELFPVELSRSKP